MSEPEEPAKGSAMPQIVLFGAVAAALIGWRIVKREMERVEQSLAPHRVKVRPEPEAIALERDPVTGVYRPRG